MERALRRNDCYLWALSLLTRVWMSALPPLTCFGNVRTQIPQTSDEDWRPVALGSLPGVQHPVFCWDIPPQGFSGPIVCSHCWTKQPLLCEPTLQILPLWYALSISLLPLENPNTGPYFSVHTTWNASQVNRLHPWSSYGFFLLEKLKLGSLW